MSRKSIGSNAKSKLGEGPKPKSKFTPMSTLSSVAKDRSIQYEQLQNRNEHQEHRQ